MIHPHSKNSDQSMLSKRLACRETGGAASSEHVFKKHCARQRFSNFTRVTQHDIHDPDAAGLKLSFLRRRSKIVEIVSAGELVITLTLSGVCTAFRGTQRLCFLNTTSDEVSIGNMCRHALSKDR